MVGSDWEKVAGTNKTHKITSLTKIEVKKGESRVLGLSTTKVKNKVVVNGETTLEVEEKLVVALETKDQQVDFNYL